jgi:hypothetical protein
MTDIREIPEPSYDRDIQRLVDAYRRAVRDIQRELAALPIEDLSRANSAAALAEIANILAGLNEESAEWVATHIPEAALDGVARTIVALGGTETLEQAKEIAKFNRINANMVAAVVADTQSDLLAVTTSIDRRVRAAVRQAVGDSMRANMAAGINGRKTISRDILAGMRKALGDAVNTGLVDSAGRRWKPDVYADMVTRTKMMVTQIDATANESLARNVQYAVISTHRAADACRFHEGRIIKLSPDAEGPYPTYEELRATGQIFHPNCRHVITPVRRPERLSSNRSTGGRSDYRPSDAKTLREYERLDRIANDMYEKIRQGTDEDVGIIAGRIGWNSADVQSVKQHVFRESHLRIDGRRAPFHPDYEIGMAWQRLIDGTHYDIDILLLNHELKESRLMKQNGWYYEKAHEEANKIHDWSSELERLRKRKG